MNRTIKQILGLSAFASGCMALGMGLSHGWVAQAQESKAVVVEPKGTYALPPIAEVAEKLNPTVVAITNKSVVKMRGRSGNPFEGDGFFDFFFGPQNPGRRGPSPEGERPETSFGSGVIVSADGEILTNRHVIESPRGGTNYKIEVKLADGRTYEAKVLGKDDQIDIALLKIDAKHLPFAQLGDSDKVRVGEWVVAIGNPLGLEHTVTQGIISAKGRSGASVGAGSAYETYLQTDAAINRGNSGGPLLNLRGEILGINTAINPMGQNIGFAVPSNLIKRIVTDLRAGRKVSRGFLGLTMENLDEAFKESLGVKAGVVVNDVQPGKPADKAGIRKLDVLTAVEGKAVNSMEEVRSAVSSHRAGETIEIDLVREGKPRKVTVTLGEYQDSAAAPEAREDDSAPDEKGNKFDLKKGYGFEVEGLTADNRRHFAIPDEKSGVLVTEVVVRSEANDKLQEGALITAVGAKSVKNLQSFKEEVKRLAGKPLILQVEFRARNGREVSTISRLVSIPPRKD